MESPQFSSVRQPPTPGEGAPMFDAESRFVALCPHCSAALKIRRVYIGQRVRCKPGTKACVAEEGQDLAAAGEAPTSPAVRADSVVVTCPSCRGTLKVRQSDLGHRVECKQCHQEFLVTDAAEDSPLLEPGRDQPGRD